MNKRINQQPENCPYCGSSKVEESGGKLVCMDCGSVVEDSTVSTDSPRFFGYEDVKKRARHGFSSYYPEARTARRNLKMANAAIDDTVNKLHLPQFVSNEAKQQYRDLIQVRTIRRDIVRGTAATLVHIVCRKSQIPVPMKLIAEVSEVGMTAMNRRYQEIVDNLKIEVPQISINGLALRYAKQIGLSAEYMGHVNSIASELEDSIKLIGKDPKGVAAAIVYMVAKEFDHEVTQHEVADIASVTDITVRSRVNALPTILG